MALERRTAELLDPDSYASREQQRVEAARKKARQVKERKKARDPYNLG